jgi:hypothetical protein
MVKTESNKNIKQIGRMVIKQVMEGKVSKYKIFKCLDRNTLEIGCLLLIAILMRSEIKRKENIR